MTEDKGELTYFTPDKNDWLPRVDLVGLQLIHHGNGKTYQITGFCWLGATDEWGFIHAELRSDGRTGIPLARPLSHIDGQRSNGERRYTIRE